jgi:hypothetical protein
LNCMPITAWNRYGTKPDGSCFEVSISDLNQMIIHTKTNIIGFTFNFKNGSTQSYDENSAKKNTFVINLNSIYMTGIDIYVGDGIEALILQLYDSTTQKFNSTEIIGNSQNGCFSYFNSSFFKSKSLAIDSIKGCFDNNQLNYFPFLEFTYSLSQCPIQVLYPKNPEISTNMISSTISVTTSSSVNPFVSNSFISSTVNLKSSKISLSVFVNSIYPITLSFSTLSYSKNINSFTVSSTTIDLSAGIPIINTITFLETSKLINRIISFQK